MKKNFKDEYSSWICMGQRQRAAHLRSPVERALVGTVDHVHNHDERAHRHVPKITGKPG
jgi:hypothetical protein